jgi:hypothetical protein
MHLRHTTWPAQASDHKQWALKQAKHLIVVLGASDHHHGPEIRVSSHQQSPSRSSFGHKHSECTTKPCLSFRLIPKFERKHVSLKHCTAARVAGHMPKLGMHLSHTTTANISIWIKHWAQIQEMHHTT